MYSVDRFTCPLRSPKRRSRRLDSAMPNRNSTNNSTAPSREPMVTWAPPTLKPRSSQPSTRPTARCTATGGSRTAARLAMAGKLTRRPLQQQAPDVTEPGGEEHGKARRQRTVNDAVVVGQRQRQDQARSELLAVPHRLERGLADTKNGHFRGIDDGREIGATNAAERADGETTARHFRRTESLVARLLG